MRMSRSRSLSPLLILLAFVAAGCQNLSQRLDAADADWREGNRMMGEPPLIDRIVADPQFERQAKADRDEARQSLDDAGIAIKVRAGDANARMDDAEADVADFLETLGLDQ